MVIGEIMKKLKLDLSHPSPTNVEVEAFQKEIGKQLPSDYLQFLMMQNGGVPTPGLSFECQKERIELIRFIPFTGLVSDDKGLFAEYLIFREEYEESELLPIAMDICGNPICLSLLDDEDKTFGFVVSVSERDEGILVALIARNFVSFLEGLEYQGF